MTKEQYFHNVQHNQGQLLYNMYREKFDEKKHGSLLQPNEFMMYIQMSGMMPAAFEAACRHYEQKLNINKLLDKDGRLIRFI